jgi:hypothetical protein
MNLRAFCESPHRDVPSFLRQIDADTAAAPESAANILATAWTAIAILSAPGRAGIPAAHWLPEIAKFRLFRGQQFERAREAIEMRQRAIERAAEREAA